jgi:hydroxymethylpyrimidine pyrophosphatase-like HAD family hydrolase
MASPRPYDLVICDIDGCLTPEGTEAFDREALERIARYNRQARAAGDRPELTLCSGRPQPFVEAMSRLLGIGAPCIAENGVWLYDPSTNAYRIDPGIGASDLEAVASITSWMRNRYAGAGAAIQPGKTASVSLYHADHHWLVAHLDEIRGHCHAEGFPLRVSMSWYYINCDLAHISKATGIGQLIAAKGFARERLAGIGDTMGDAAIRERVAFFACPANADERLRLLADYVSPFEVATGVVDILERLQSGPTGGS